MEVWKDIKEYKGLYQISNLGNIKSIGGSNGKIKMDRILILKKNRFGYFRIGLHANDTIKYFQVHRLVAQAFIQNPLNKPQINHKNGIKTDNRIENLEWCTASENIKHGIRIGLIKCSYGSNHWNSKLNRSQVDEIRLNYLIESISTFALAKKYNISQPQICNIINHKSWK